MRSPRRHGAGPAGALALLLALAGAPAPRAADAGGEEPAGGGPSDEAAAPLDLWELRDLAGEDAGAAADALIAAEGLPPAIARSVVEAVLRAEQLEDEWSDAQEAPPAAARQAIEEELLDVLAAAPESRLAGAALADLYWSFDGLDLEASAARLAARVEALPDPARSALVLSDEIPHGAPGRALLELALERRPGHPVLLDQLARLSGDLAVPAALYEAAWESLAEMRPAPPPAAVRYFAHRRLAALLAALELDEAAAFLAAEGERLGVTAGDVAGSVEAELGGLPLRGEWHEDLRLHVAALGWLVGDRDSARRLLAAGPAEEATPAGAPPPAASPEPEGVTRKVLERLLAPRAEDPFRLLISLVASREGGAGDPVGAPVIRLAAAELAEREGYPDVAAYLLEGLVGGLAWDDGVELRAWQPALDLPLLGDELDRRIETRARRLVTLAHELRVRRESLRAQAAADDRGAALVARALAAAVRPRFVEQPLPAGIAPAALDREREDEERARQAEGLEPPDFEFQRVERSGAEVVAVATDGRARLWVLRSRDGGATWADPLATGLRWRDPYGVPPVSALPLAAADGLRLEVELWASEDPTTAPADPDAEPAPRARGVYLEIPWADLERDGDDDGLTDLAEAWLLTDPHDPDGDRDGLPDGRDPLPHVARSLLCDARAEALAAVLQAAGGAGGWQPPEGGRLPGRCSAAAGSPPLPAHRTSYVLGRRSWFAPLHPASRLVVLDESELDSTEAALGDPFPIRLQLLAFDRADERALAVWDHGFGGGVLTMRRFGGFWWKTLEIRSGGCLTSIDDSGSWLDPLDP